MHCEHAITLVQKKETKEYHMIQHRHEGQRNRLNENKSTRVPHLPYRTIYVQSYRCAAEVDTNDLLSVSRAQKKADLKN